METYESMRQFADSWALLAMVAFFVGIVLWVFFSPNAANNAHKAARIPFEEKPAAPRQRNQVEASGEEGPNVRA